MMVLQCHIIISVKQRRRLTHSVDIIAGKSFYILYFSKLQDLESENVHI